MGKQFRVFIIIPKVNMTEIAVFLHKTCLYKQVISHDQPFSHNKYTLDDIVHFRSAEIMDQLFNSGINVSKIDAISSIGGMLKPMEGGTYIVTDTMIADLKRNYSGLKAYFNVEQIDDVFHVLQNNNIKHDEVISAMTYQIAKEIGSMATVLQGEVDGIVLTGQLATLNVITNLIIKRVSWIADTFTYPGEYDLQAIHEGTLRVLHREVKAKYYS